ncbi:MAG: hypothetical protein HC837_05680 [Chloroflexaceae bacterium]|nr:hypothetical protein [Chloroflexaceae bacterium]
MIAAENYRDAWNVLSSNFQASQKDFESYVSWFQTAICDVYAQNIITQSQNSYQATVSAKITFIDRPSGCRKSFSQTFIFNLIADDGNSWLIDSVNEQ